MQSDQVSVPVDALKVVLYGETYCGVESFTGYDEATAKLMAILREHERGKEAPMKIHEMTLEDAEHGILDVQLSGAQQRFLADCESIAATGKDVRIITDRANGCFRIVAVDKEPT